MRHSENCARCAPSRFTNKRGSMTAASNNFLYCFLKKKIFERAKGLHANILEENSVCLSVRLAYAKGREKNQNQTNQGKYIATYYKRLKFATKFNYFSTRIYSLISTIFHLTFLYNRSS